jgi:hypothetical protein
MLAATAMTLSHLSLTDSLGSHNEIVEAKFWGPGPGFRRVGLGEDKGTIRVCLNQGVTSKLVSVMVDGLLQVLVRSDTMGLLQILSR